MQIDSQNRQAKQSRSADKGRKVANALDQSRRIAEEVRILLTVVMFMVSGFT